MGGIRRLGCGGIPEERSVIVQRCSSIADIQPTIKETIGTGRNIRGRRVGSSPPRGP